MEDDGAERGMVFIFVGADLRRQFEFIQREWVRNGTFIGTSAEKDPLIGPNDGMGSSPSRSNLSDGAFNACHSS